MTHFFGIPMERALPTSKAEYTIPCARLTVNVCMATGKDGAETIVFLALSYESWQQYLQLPAL